MTALFATSCGDDGVAPESEPALVVVSPALLFLEPGDTANLAVAILDGSGRQLTGVPVEFATSRPSVITVSSTGLVTAEAAGPDTATITVRVRPSGPASTVPVVVHLPIGGIEILPRLLKMRPGATAQVTARVYDILGATIPGVPVTYLGRDAGLVTATPEGLLTAGANWGSTYVVAAYVTRDDRVFADSATVAVAPIAATPALSSRPFGVAVSPSATVYITRLDSDVLGVMALPDDAIAAGPAVGAVPTNVIFDAAGTTAYVTNQSSQTIGVIDVAAGVQTRTVALGADPFALALEPGGQRLFATTNANEVVVIDLTTASVSARVPVGFAPNGIAFHPAQPVAYVSAVWDGTLSKISTVSLSVTKVVTLGGAPQALAFAPDGSELYVADEQGGQVRIVDPGSDTQVGSVPLGGGAFDLVLTADATGLLVSLPWSGEVVRVDRLSRLVSGRIPTFGTPRRIGCTADGGLCLVANELGWVDVLEF